MDSKRKPAIYLFFFTLLFFSCEKEKLNSKSEMTKPEFPNCKLISKELQTSYGKSQKTVFNYEQGKLVKKDFYYGDIYNSSDYFTYDNQGNVHLRLIYDSYHKQLDTIGSYEFENNLLTTHTHYNTDDQSIQTKMEFEYENTKLKYVTTTNEEGQFKFMIETDDFGNPTRYELVERNNSIPDQKVMAIFEYDNKLNPYYKLPGLVDMEYFSISNLLKARTFIDGVEQKNTSEKVFEYYDNNLLHISTDKFSQGFHILTYKYECE